jgi:hypothetical protein
MPPYKIITDIGPAFVEALNWLAEQYRIHHIRISPYNSQVNGIVEHHHLDVREAIMKVCDGEERKWPTAMHAVVNGVLLPSIALNCLPGCCTRMFTCSGILD